MRRSSADGCRSPLTRSSASVSGSSRERASQQSRLHRGACEGHTRDWIFQSVVEARRFSPEESAQDAGPWLIFEDAQGLGARIAKTARRRGERCFTVQPGRGFVRLASDRFEIDPDRLADYQMLLSEIAAKNEFPRSVVASLVGMRSDRGKGIAGRSADSRDDELLQPAISGAGSGRNRSRRPQCRLRSFPTICSRWPANRSCVRVARLSRDLAE